MGFAELLSGRGVTDAYEYTLNTGTFKIMMAENSARAIAVTDFWHEFFLWERIEAKKEPRGENILHPYKSHTWIGAGNSYILARTPVAKDLSPCIGDDVHLHVAILYGRSISSPRLKDMAALQTEFDDKLRKHQQLHYTQCAEAEALAKRICFKRVEHEQKLNAAIAQTAEIETQLDEILSRAAALRTEILNES